MDPQGMHTIATRISELEGDGVVLLRTILNGTDAALLVIKSFSQVSLVTKGLRVPAIELKQTEIPVAEQFRVGCSSCVSAKA